MEVNTEWIKNFREQVKQDYAVDGWCHRNAYLLAEELCSHGFIPYIVWGYLEGSGTFETVEEAEISGLVHFWVEISDGGKQKTLDLHSLDPKFKGEAICREGSPSTYKIPTEDPVYIDFKSCENWLTPEHLLNEEDYQVLCKKDVIVKNPI